MGMQAGLWGSRGIRAAFCALAFGLALTALTPGRALGQSSGAPEASGVQFGPPWFAVVPTSTVKLAYDPKLSQTSNGSALKKKIQSLQPGQRLVIGPGTWSIDSLFSIDLSGSVDKPIWIVAQRGAAVRITRPDASQNTINIGSKAAARYLVLRGLEVTGGDTGIKMYDCQNVWIDLCNVHDVGGAGISANSRDTSHLYITRNQIHATAGTGEGMYLGANNSAAVMSHSVIARNHVYDTSGSQGDGIEVKQGSYDNQIVENLVHDTPYPCILVYGTDGNAPNVVERNICYNSGDNVMQVQGEAIVRNNLLINGNRAFSSHDHQGQSRDLVFVHNTVINTGRAAHMQSWDGRPGMVFANNVVYSQTNDAIRFANGSADVILTGNVVLGSVVGASGGFTQGTGLGDFVDLTWNGSSRDAHPRVAGKLIGSGNPFWAVFDDLSAAPRARPVDSGCYDGL